MKSIKEIKLRDEAELEALLVQNPEQIENGFTILTHQRKTFGFKTLDILGIDSEGILTLIELKNSVDEGQLRQTILYYDWLLQQGIDWISDAYRTQLGEKKIAEKMPQIFLISPEFEDEMLTEVKYIREDIKIRLFKFIALEIEEQKYIKLIEDSIQSIKAIETKPWTLKDNVEYISDKEVKSLFVNFIKEIKEIDKGIEEKPLNYFISFWIKGRKFCDLYPRKNSFAIGFKVNSEKKWENLNNISTKEQVENAFNLIFSAYELMKK
jgi:predicted transport protein